MEYQAPSFAQGVCARPLPYQHKIGSQPKSEEREGKGDDNRGDGRLADMDASGIDMQVLSLAVSGVEELDAATATALARDTNDTVAAAVRMHPDRFAAFEHSPVLRRINFYWATPDGSGSKHMPRALTPGRS